MKLNVSTVLTGFDGIPLPNTKTDATTTPLTVKDVVVNVVAMPSEHDTGMDKVRKFDLAMKLFKAVGEVELTVEEAKEVKDCVGKSAYGPLVVGQILHLID